MTFSLQPALAQVPDAASTTADPGRVDETLREQRFIPDVSPQVEVKDMILQSAPPGAEKITFTLKSISLDGVSVYGSDALSGLYADKLGTTVSLADVYSIANDMTNKYRNDGYILTQVVIPPQTIDGGNVQFNVVEGYVDQVVVEGNDQDSALALIRSYGNQISANKALNVKDLERSLLLINDLPGVEARSVLSPSRTKTGAADLRIIVERDTFDAFAGVDNFGSRYLGPVQGSVAAGLNSYFGNNERISGQYVVAPDWGEIELSYFALNYAQPIWNYGTQVELSTSLTDTTPGYNLENLDVEGRSQLFSGRVVHPFLRSRTTNLNGYLGFDWRDVRSDNELETRREDNIRSVRAGGQFEMLDNFFGVGINSADVELSKGVDIFGASGKGDVDLSRGRGDPQYTKLTAELQRLQRITPVLNLLVAGRGQWSANALLSSEEFGVGGISYGRGYDPSEIVGDEGFAAKAELQWKRPVQWDLVEDYEVYGFFDGGKVFNKDSTTAANKTNSLASTGVGVRADLMQETEAGVALAFPLTREVETQGDKDARVLFNLNKKF